jgi:hypothetical protein
MSRLVGRLGHFCSVGGQAGLFVFSFLPVHGDGLTRGDSGFFTARTPLFSRRTSWFLPFVLRIVIVIGDVRK